MTSKEGKEQAGRDQHSPDRLTVKRFLMVRDSPYFRMGEWRDDAACRAAIENHPEKFSEFDWVPQEIKPDYVAEKPVAICVECPVRLECLVFALTTPHTVNGIFAGRSIRKIDAIRRKLNQALSLEPPQHPPYNYPWKG